MTTDSEVLALLAEMHYRYYRSGAEERVQEVERITEWVLAQQERVERIERGTQALLLQAAEHWGEPQNSRRVRR